MPGGRSAARIPTRREKPRARATMGSRAYCKAVAIDERISLASL